MFTSDATPQMSFLLLKIKYVLKKYDGRARTGFIWLATRQVAGSCKHGNDPSNSMNLKGIS
jgi:hypothetical protein